MKSIFRFIICLCFLGELGCQNDPSKTRSLVPDLDSKVQIETASVSDNSLNDEKYLPRTLGSQDYLSWMKDPGNGLLKQKMMGDFKYELIYTPQEYFLAKNGSFTINEEMKSEAEVLDGLQFVFRIHHSGGPLNLAKWQVSNQSEFDQRIKYLSFEMKKDFYLEAMDGEIIRCSGCHYERDYNLAPYASFTLSFLLPPNTTLDQYRVVYSDKLFNHGNIKFRWNENQIQSLPKLALNE